MEQSILKSTKNILGLPDDYTVFDLQVLTHINSAFSTLTQLGVGPAAGFTIEDATPVWEDFIGIGPKYQEVKSYVFLKVKSLFDPPQTSYLIDAMNAQIREFEWRLNVSREGTAWSPGTIPLSGVIYGGDAVDG